MMGGILTKNQVTDFKALMNWDIYEDETNNPEDIKLTLSDSGLKRNVINEGGDTSEVNSYLVDTSTLYFDCTIASPALAR